MNMKRETLEQIKKVCGYKSAEPDKVAEIFALYRQFINPNANLCATCGDSIRASFSTLKTWFNDNKENLERNITHQEKMDELKKKMEVDVKPVESTNFDEIKKEVETYTEAENKIIKNIGTKNNKNGTSKKKQ